MCEARTALVTDQISANFGIESLLSLELQVDLFGFCESARGFVLLRLLQNWMDWYCRQI